MRYIIKTNLEFDNIRDFCTYSDSSTCKSGSGIGTGNYSNVDVGV